MRRMIFHNLPSMISVGVDVTDEGDVFVALAACNRKDQPERRWANRILDARLTSEKGHRRFYMGNYAGEDIGGEVFGPVRDTIRDLSARRNVKDVPFAIHKGLREGDVEWTDESEPTRNLLWSWRDCCSSESCTMSPASSEDKVS